MKKRLFPFLLILALLLPACQKQAELEVPTIQPKAFSKETQDLLNLIGDTYFFDFTVDESLQAFTIDYWSYADGQWEQDTLASDNFTDLRHTGLGFQVSDESLVLYDDNENGKSKATIPVVMRPPTQDGKGIARYALNTAQTIKPNEDIILYQYLVSLDQKIYTSDIGHFDGGHYGSGTALTITFYDHPLEG